MVKITFLDGEELIIDPDTVISGYKKIESDNKKEYYLRIVFKDSINGEFSTDGSLINTDNPKIGLAGLLLSVDCFAIGLDDRTSVTYLSSAVKSIENI
ncbi:hypothetical protein MOC08_03935 [Bacillus haynesii]|uniref:hypothetical protein n=1 Tax=Bacillus haynesii TaxID=1925021 RepID=UPI0022830E47|nr:hypothetical protein [Bacillus haynesii]MCY8240387.1 hypothetical protein [Bacillus haynesii]